MLRNAAEAPRPREVLPESALATGADPGALGGALGGGGRLALRDVSLGLALVLIWAFFASTTPTFLSPRNLSNLAVELSITAVVSLGMLLVIIAGQIDLSVGSGAGLFGGLTTVLMFRHGWPAPAAMAVSLLLGVIVWAAMGYLIVGQRIPAFIITLAGLLVFRGLQWMVIHNATIPVTVGHGSNALAALTAWYLPPPAGYVLAAVIAAGLFWTGWLARRRAAGLRLEPADLWFARTFVAAQLVLLFVTVCNQYRGVPLPALILAAAAIGVGFLLRHTVFGRHLYAVGGNEEAAVISGISVRRVVVGAFAILGFLVALCGLMQTAYAGASTTTIGQLLELDAIAACVIGGTSLRGGRGTVAGVLFGSLIMASLLNGLTLRADSPEVKFIARGCVLALAVWLDVRVSRYSDTP
jgi:D-xylose transport system permease protein